MGGVSNAGQGGGGQLCRPSLGGKDLLLCVGAAGIGCSLPAAFWWLWSPGKILP